MKETDVLTETVSKQKPELLDMEARLKQELKVRESRLTCLIGSASRAKQNYSPELALHSLSEPDQTSGRLQKKRRRKTQNVRIYRDWK